MLHGLTQKARFQAQTASPQLSTPSQFQSVHPSLSSGKTVFDANTNNLVIYDSEVESEYKDYKRKELPAWIPEALRKKLETLLGWSKDSWMFQSWDTQTGKLRAMFPIPMSGYYQVKASSDGLLLAVEDNNELSLWDIPPRRSMTCWLVCCSVAVFAFWLAWPRKMKLA